MHRHLKRNLAIGTTALAAAAFAGGAYAANEYSPKSARQAFLANVAKRLNVTPEQLTTALQGALNDQLAAAVKAGQLTQAQANAIKQRIAHGAAGPLPLRPLLFGSPGPRGPRFFTPGLLAPALLGLAGHSPLGAAAKYLGLTDAQLFDQLRAGKTLAQVAQSHGKSVTGLKQAMFGAEKARLDRAVAAKRITPAQEQQAIKRLTSRLDEQLSRNIRRLPYPGAPAGAVALPPPSSPD